ncbi:MAG TPA: MFS transporter, partial [Acidimicrobiia bacterium]
MLTAGNILCNIAIRFRLLHPFGVAASSMERLAMAISAGALGTLGFSVTAPLLPDLAEALGVSRASIGVIQAAVSVPGVLLSILIGYFADRFGRRRVVLISLVVFTTFGVAGFFARSFWSLAAVRFVQGAGTSGILGLGIVLVGDLFEGSART